MTRLNDKSAVKWSAYNARLAVAIATTLQPARVRNISSNAENNPNTNPNPNIYTATYV